MTELAGLLEQFSLLPSLFWIGVTLSTYLLSQHLYAYSKRSPLLIPIAVTSLILATILLTFDIDYRDYRQSVWWLELLIFPATVALALPLYKQSKVLYAMGWRVVLPIAIGGILAPSLAWVSLYLLDTPLNLQMTMLVKSITTPLAMGTSELIGGIADLAAVFVILTGIVGAVFGPFLFRMLQVDSELAQGVALGTVAHVVGTTRAISTSEICGAFSSLALCLNGIATAIVLPLLFA